jgi:hypothetical protein
VGVALARDDPEIEPTVDVAFNGRRLTQFVPGAAPAELEVPLLRRTRRSTATCCASSSLSLAGPTRRMMLGI